jgi:asparagine synthase (glutamine-hydrolysing)
MGQAELSSMRDALAHRGPDDAGLCVWDDAGNTCNDGRRGVAGLGHRRLSIIDCSPAGHQPMANEAATLWIAFNGEFYNFADFRTALSAKHNFRSRSDTEVLLHLCEEQGIDTVLKNVNGMFAFALWDTRKRQLTLARDRLGKKPLYYVPLPDGGLVFASELKALIAGGFVDTSKLDPLAFTQFWTYGYTTGERTFYRDARRLLPGHYAVWQDGRLAVREYWDAVIGTDVFQGRRTDDLADELETLLCDSIRLRLISDVPLGLFLSGGADSSLVAALAAKVTGRTIKSFTVAFREAKMNEAPYAAAVARHLGIENVSVAATEDMRPCFETVARHFDEPFGDSSALPTYLVAKLARQHVTVALTGDAGDELFGGYDAYAKALWLWGDRRQRRLFGPKRPLIQRLMEVRKRLTRGDDRLTRLEMLLDEGELRCIVDDSVRAAIAGQDPFWERRRWYDRAAAADLLSQLQYMNLKTYLPDDILVKVDRMSMAHALECRSPFLDYRIVEFAARLPYAAKIDNSGRQKRILWELLDRYMPESLTNRPKMGFSVPLADWCRGALGDQWRARWRALNSPWLKSSAAERLFPRHKLGWTALQWNAFCTMLFLDRDPPPGPPTPCQE